jgi:hypothetical protein
MNKETILILAKNYLNKNDISFAEPAEFGRLDGCKQEVVFLNPDMFDPNVAIVIPEDIRVWVDIKTKEVTLIYQM